MDYGGLESINTIPQRLKTKNYSHLAKNPVKTPGTLAGLLALSRFLRPFTAVSAGPTRRQGHITHPACSESLSRLRTSYGMKWVPPDTQDKVLIPKDQ